MNKEIYTPEQKDRAKQSMNAYTKCILKKHRTPQRLRLTYRVLSPHATLSLVLIFMSFNSQPVTLSTNWKLSLGSFPSSLFTKENSAILSKLFVYGTVTAWNAGILVLRRTVSSIRDKSPEDKVYDLIQVFVPTLKGQ